MLSQQTQDPTRIGPYRIIGRLGSGAMGQVFLGVGGRGEPVAVKIVHRAFAGDPQFRARFHREVTSGMRVSGPGLARMVGAAPQAPLPWLATEYVHGPSLQRAVQETGPLPWPTMRTLVAGLAGALTTIHAAGLVHRDVKPSNVLLGPDGPRLIDLGISRAIDATALSGTGAVIGTPAFMSPEQAESGAVGPASDVFSLGTLLVHAARGHGPFGDASSAAVLMRRIVDEPADLSGLTGPLRSIAQRCLAKDPAARPTAACLARELGPVPPVAPHAWLPAPVAALTPQATSQTLPAAPTPGPAAPARRTTRRALLAGGGAALGLATVGGAVALTRGARPGGPGTGAPPGAPTTSAIAPGSATQVWSVPGPERPDTIVTDGRSVFVGGRGTVAALDTGSGAQRWTYTAPPGGSGALAPTVRLALDGDRLYVATNGAAIALDAATGRELWNRKSQLSGTAAGIPLDVMAGLGGVYFTHGAAVTSFDPATGTPGWHHMVDGSFATSPEIDGSFVLVSDGGGVDALDAATGRRVWQHRPAGYGGSTEIGVAHGTVFETTLYGGVTALDVATGAVRWQAGIGSGDTAGAANDERPVVVDDALIVRGRDDLLHAFEIADGTPRWTLPGDKGGAANITPFAFRDSTGGLVYTGDFAGRIYAFDVAAGTERWRYEPPADASGASVVTAADRIAFVGEFAGRVSAIRGAEQ